jgi:hypothetical protein
LSQENASPTSTASPIAASAAAAPAWKRNPDQRADAGHQGKDEQIADRVGGCAAGQDRAAGHGQGAEPVDHAAGQVVGDGHAGLRGTKGDRQHEDAGQDVVDVAVDAGRVDGAAVGVVEQQHEHHRLHGGERDQGRHPHQAVQVAAGDGGGVGQQPRQPAGRGGGDGPLGDGARAHGSSC